MGILINLLVSAIAVFVTANIIPGVHVADFWTAVIVAIALGLVNAILKPILTILTLPITLITLGLFSFVINALLILLVANLVRGFEVNGFLAAILFSIVLSIVNSVLNVLKK